METGQMIAVMPPMPVSIASSQVDEVLVPMGKVDGAFAGLLKGLSGKKLVQVAAAEQPVPLKEDVVTNGVRSALLTTAGNGEKQASPEQIGSTEVKDDTSSLQDNPGPESQNVMSSVNGEPFIPLFAQLHGRMPEAGSTTGSRSVRLREILQTDRSVTGQPDGAVLEQIRREAPVQQAAITAIRARLEDFLQPEVDKTIPIPKLLETTIASGGEPVTVAIGSSILVATQNGSVVTEGDKQAVIKSADTPRVDVITSAPAERVLRQSEQIPQTIEVKASVPIEKAKVALAQDRDSLRIAAVMQQLQDSSLNTVDEPVVLAKMPLQETTTVLQAVSEPGNKVSQTDQPVVVSRVVSLPSASAATLPLQMSEQENEVVEPVALQPGMTGQQEQLQKVRSSGTIVSLPAVANYAADGKPETAPVRLEQREAGKSPQSEQVDTAKNIVASSSGETPTSNDEQETADRGMNGNFSSHVLHQQVKTDGSLTASTASGAAQNDTSRLTLPPEQVVQQVRDRLVNHETKPGSEQIVLRLSPEHLGELKVNLNLEGQRLKVEIVAENRMVRDSLMQHIDALKESLSRQNIKMDSFEVTTGGFGASDGSRGQGSWRELAQQRQQNAWMPDGGYRLAAQTAPVLAAYQMKSEHTMVDLHF